MLILKYCLLSLIFALHFCTPCFKLLNLLMTWALLAVNILMQSISFYFDTYMDGKIYIAVDLSKNSRTNFIIIATLVRNHGARWRYMMNTTPQPLYHTLGKEPRCPLNKRMRGRWTFWRSE